MDANPYATPRVELVEQGIPDAFRRRWTPAQLRILAWLCLASIAGGVVLMVLSLLEAFGDGAAFRVYADWLGLLLSLLGAYLLLRLKHLVESRFRGPSLAWPVWLSILLTLLGEGWSLLAVTDDALQGWNWQALVYFALLALIGATTLWLGLRLLKQENLIRRCGSWPGWTSPAARCWLRCCCWCWRYCRRWQPPWPWRWPAGARRGSWSGASGQPVGLSSVHAPGPWGVSRRPPSPLRRGCLHAPEPGCD